MQRLCGDDDRARTRRPSRPGLRLPRRPIRRGWRRRGHPYIKKGKAASKRAIVALVERGDEVRVTHMPKVTSKNIRDFAVRNADRANRLHTDESNLYSSFGGEFAAHETVNHSAKEYACGDVTANSVEDFFSVSSVS